MRVWPEDRGADHSHRPCCRPPHAPPLSVRCPVCGRNILFRHPSPAQVRAKARKAKKKGRKQQQQQRQQQQPAGNGRREAAGAKASPDGSTPPTGAPLGPGTGVTPRHKQTPPWERDAEMKRSHKDGDGDPNALCIADLGCSMIYSKHPTQLDRLLVGTPGYIAPEVIRVRAARGLDGFGFDAASCDSRRPPPLQECKYTPACDMWALGVILWTMLVGYPPFVGTSDRQIFEHTRKGKFAFFSEDWVTVSVRGQPVHAAPCSRACSYTTSPPTPTDPCVA